MEQNEHLTRFLIQRLILMLLLIAISQSLISLVFTSVLYPFINTHFHIDILGIVNKTSSSPTAIAVSLLWFICFGISRVTPLFIAAPFRVLADKMAANGWQNFLDELPSKNVTTIAFGLSLFFSIGLLVYLTPYAVATLLYSKWIVREVSNLRRQDEKKREEFNRQRNLLLSDIAHDLKTPITTISGYSDALRDQIISDKNTRREYLNTISRKSLQMNQLINLLFQYVTLDSEGFQLKYTREDISELVREAVANCYSDIENAGMDLELQVPEMALYHSVDTIQLTRAITNLIGNAWKHNPRGTVIYVSVLDLYDHIAIIVADTGLPIPNELVPHLFDPFVMGDDSRTHRGGSGLGLSISAKIMELHGGSLKLKQPFEKNGKEYTKAFQINIGK